MTELHHDTLTVGDAAPERWILFCHGILGRGANWRGFARKLLQELPGWGAILVDLRAHGGSRGVAGRDSLETAAADLFDLFDARPVKAVVGHSFGGKVALELSRHRPIEHLFVVDSLPAARPEREGSEGTMRVVKMLRHAPAFFVDRAAFRGYVAEMGFSESLALWLSQNLDPIDDGYELGLDIDRIEALLHDYFVTDLWSAIDPPPTSTTAHLIIGGESTVFDAEDHERAIDVAARHGRVHVTVLPEADHWVHVDDPEGLTAAIVEALA